MRTVSANKWTLICQNSPEDALVKMLSSPQLEVAYAAQAELSRRSAPNPCPMLDKWRKEMRDGKRDAYVFDELWKKACEETNEMEKPRQLITG